VWRGGTEGEMCVVRGRECELCVERADRGRVVCGEGGQRESCVWRG